MFLRLVQAFIQKLIYVIYNVFPQDLVAYMLKNVVNCTIFKTILLGLYY
jgi:hypothetical protein